MKKYSSVFVILMISIIMSGVLLASGCQKKSAAAESLFDKTARTKEINCGYIIEAPYCFQDTTDNALAGIFVDVMEEIGNKLQMKINWQEEVSERMVLAYLDSLRFDVLGSGIEDSPENSQKVLLTKPIFYHSVHIWVRTGETRITSPADINSPEIRISCKEGTIFEQIANASFPDAQKIIVSQLDPSYINYRNVVQDSADVFLAGIGDVDEYLAVYPGTLQEVVFETPLKGLGESFAMKAGETQFKELLDKAIDELTASGYLENIVTQYASIPGQFIPVTAPANIQP